MGNSYVPNFIWSLWITWTYITAELIFKYSFWIQRLLSDLVLWLKREERERKIDHNSMSDMVRILFWEWKSWGKYFILVLFILPYSWYFSVLAQKLLILMRFQATWVILIQCEVNSCQKAFLFDKDMTVNNLFSLCVLMFPHSLVCFWKNLSFEKFSIYLHYLPFC